MIRLRNDSKVIAYLLLVGAFLSGSECLAKKYAVPSVPSNPSSATECKQWKDAVHATYKALLADNGACLDSCQRSYGMGTKNRICVVDTCYPIQRQADEIYSMMTEQSNRCFALVREADQQREQERRAQEAQQQQRDAFAQAQERQAQANQQRQQDAHREQQSRQRQQEEKMQSNQAKLDSLGSLVRDLFSFEDPPEPAPRAAPPVQQRKKTVQIPVESAQDRARRAEEEKQQRAVAEQNAYQKMLQETKSTAKSEESLYQQMLAKVGEAKDAYSATKEFIDNPFDSVVNRVADAGTSNLTSRNTRIGPEKRDATYDTIAAGTDEARGAALSRNPFAGRVAGAAAEQLHSTNRQIAGQMDVIDSTIRDIGQTDTSTRGPNPFVYRKTPGIQVSDPSDARSAASSRSAAADTTSPQPARTVSPPVQVARTQVQANPSRSTPSDDSYPSNSNTPQTATQTSNSLTATHFDRESGQTFTIPAGYTLYRDPSTRRLSVVSLRSLESASIGRDGSGACSALGTGIVTPVCEAQRQKAKNPFAKK